MYISLVDLSSRPVLPDSDTLSIKTTCTNRDLPSRLPFGDDTGDFELEASTGIKKIVALTKPTSTLRPAVGRSVLWRLISHLSLNYLSLVEDGREALQEILKLYNFTDSSFSEKQIEGIIGLNSRKHFARVISENGVAFARGTQVEIAFSTAEQAQGEPDPGRQGDDRGSISFQPAQRHSCNEPGQRSDCQFHRQGAWKDGRRKVNRAYDRLP
jgi:type VI secretion system protein ImpG